MKLMNLLAGVASVVAVPLALAQKPLTPHPIHLADGKTLTLQLPPEFAIDVAVQGLHRVRFLAKSPDGRIFATDMYALADNNRGAVLILDGWDEKTHTFARVVPYLEGLRNPNNVAFYTDASGQSWIYVPLTDKLVRYRYAAGDMKPTSAPEVLATYPDYGLNYKYGGWHLTRTVAIANLHGKPKVYVAVGSSCNACREKEEVRATLSEMDPDGKNPRIIARGLRNAVGLVAVAGIDGGALFGTNMGADHLGDGAPEDTFFELDSTKSPATGAADYGWPTCYFEGGTAHADRLIAHPQPGDHTVPAPPAGPPPAQVDCAKVPAAYTTFASHSSPLGVAWFGGESTVLKDSFVVALHGAGKQRIGTGYRVVRFSPGSRRPEDFVTGFYAKVSGDPLVAGRPCGILPVGPDSFLLTDDHDGVIYLVRPR
jgi:glucose/arabinose dehydrogenase